MKWMLRKPKKYDEVVHNLHASNRRNHRAVQLLVEVNPVHGVARHRCTNQNHDPEVGQTHDPVVDPDLDQEAAQEPELLAQEPELPARVHVHAHIQGRVHVRGVEARTVLVRIGLARGHAVNLVQEVVAVLVRKAVHPIVRVRIAAAVAAVVVVAAAVAVVAVAVHGALDQAVDTKAKAFLEAVAVAVHLGRGPVLEVDAAVEVYLAAVVVVQGEAHDPAAEEVVRVDPKVVAEVAHLLFERDALLF